MVSRERGERRWVGTPTIQPATSYQPVNHLPAGAKGTRFFLSLLSFFSFLTSSNLPFLTVIFFFFVLFRPVHYLTVCVRDRNFFFVLCAFSASFLCSFCLFSLSYFLSIFLIAYNSGTPCSQLLKYPKKIILIGFSLSKASSSEAILIS